MDPITFLATVGTLLRSQYPYINSNYGEKAGFYTTSGICAVQNRISIGNGTSQSYSGLTDT